MTAHTAAAANWSWELIARALAGLTALFGTQMPGWISRAAWRRACRELRVMEALARRLILVMSAQCEPGLTAPRHTAGKRAARVAGMGAGFALFDPLPTGAEAPLIKATPLPEDFATPTCGLARRMAALAAVMAAPEAAAMRMARWLARPVGARTTPICLTRPQGPLAEPLSDALTLFQRLAVERLNAPP
jgi:hypothetical protein